MTKPSSSAELSRHESLMVLAVFVPTRFDGAANAVGVIPLPTTKSVMLCAGKLTLTAAVENNQKTEKKDNTKLKIKRFFEKFLSIFFSSGEIFSAALLVRFQSIIIISFSAAGNQALFSRRQAFYFWKICLRVTTGTRAWTSFEI